MGEDRAIRIDPLGFAGVEEGSVTVYRRDDRTPGPLSAGLIPEKTRFSAWITRLEISPLQQSTSPLIVSIIVAAQQSRFSHSC
jgi:hypothetical protein